MVRCLWRSALALLCTGLCGCVPSSAPTPAAPGGSRLAFADGTLFAVTPRGGVVEWPSYSGKGHSACGLSGVAHLGTGGYAVKTDESVWLCRPGVAAPERIQSPPALEVDGGGMPLLALLPDGGIRTLGRGPVGPVPGIGDAVQVAAGYIVDYALLRGGTVVAWGNGTSGELGNGNDELTAVPVQVAGLSGVMEIAAGSKSGFALMPDGTIRGWGWAALGDGTAKTSDTPVRVINVTHAQAICAVGYGAFALEADGTVWAWGNGFGIIPKPLFRVPGATSLAADQLTGWTVAAMRPDGAVFRWTLADRRVRRLRL